jgi:sulfate permease, SulP family
MPGAIAIALMAYLETVSVARGVRRPTDPPIDNNQELVANGAASVAGAFFGSMPPAGGFSQTAVNQRAGSQTQVSGLVTVGLAIAAALFLGAPLDDLPEATLGAIVLVAVVGLIKPTELAFLARFDRLELFVALLTAAVGLTAGLLVAVAVGVAANLLLVLRELNHPDVDELRASPDGTLVPAADGLAATPGLLVLRIGAPLYTANVREAQRQIVGRVEAAEPPPRVVVVDATVVGRLSVTTLQVFRELDQELRDRGVELWIASLPPRALEQARTAPGWDAMDRAGRLHPTARAALDAFVARM